jgi:alpha-tubulin suppressor-like RCC1 family protein
MLKFHSVLKSSRAAIDLASIMVGVIIIGLIGGVIAATVFAVIPWSQDKAAKQQLEAIATAENAQYGKSSEGNSKPFYGDSAVLASSGWLQQGENYCVVTPDEDKQSYKAAVKSASGKVFVSTNKAPNPVEAVTGETTCIGVGTGTGTTNPAPVPAPTTAVSFLSSSMGSANHMVVNKNNALYSWGTNTAGQLGDGTLVSTTLPVKSLDGKFTQIALSKDWTVALQDDNTLWAWGNNGNGWLNAGSVGKVVTPTKVTIAGTPLEGKTIKQIAATPSFYYVLTSNNELYKSTIRFSSKVSFTGTALVSTNITKLATDSDSDAYFVISSEGKLYAGGAGGNYLQADGSGDIHTAPLHEIGPGTQLAGKTVTDIAVAGNTARALTSDGRLYGWGYNNFSEIGFGSSYSALKPLETPLTGTPLEGKTITNIAAGSNHTLVVTSEGKVYSAGSNALGQRGIGTATSINAYMAVATAGTPMDNQKIVAITAGKNVSYALDSNGKLYGWGSGSQLGSGPIGMQKAPIEIALPE